MAKRKAIKPRKPGPKLGKTSAGPTFGKKKSGKSIFNQISGFLLGTNKLVRDANAINKGQIADRVVRRATGKMASKGLGSDIFKINK